MDKDQPSRDFICKRASSIASLTKEEAFPQHPEELALVSLNILLADLLLHAIYYNAGLGLDPLALAEEFGQFLQCFISHLLLYTHTS